jgi:uncharacterized membrane protein YhiD involved in acid resistance
MKNNQHYLIAFVSTLLISTFIHAQPPMSKTESQTKSSRRSKAALITDQKKENERKNDEAISQDEQASNLNTKNKYKKTYRKRRALSPGQKAEKKQKH